MEHSFGTYLIIGVLLLAWLGTHVLEDKVHRAGAWFVALTIAFVGNLFTPLRPGVESVNVGFFGTLLGTIISGAYFVWLLSSADSTIDSTSQALESLDEDATTDASPIVESLCLKCKYAKPHEGKYTVLCAFHNRAIPSHHMCPNFESAIEPNSGG